MKPIVILTTDFPVQLYGCDRPNYVDTEKSMFSMHKYNTYLTGVQLATC